MSLREHSGRSIDKVESILGAARQGDDSQLGTLLELYRGYLLTIAAEKLAQDVSVKAAPSDLIQETFLQASQGFTEFRGSTAAEVLTWLKQILLRKVIDVHRHYRDYDKRDISRERRLDDVSFQSGTMLDAIAKVDPPSARARTAENATIVQEALNRLNEEHRRAIQLRNYEQLGFEEIGMRLGKTAEAARKLWTRAVQNLTVELRAHDPGSS